MHPIQQFVFMSISSPLHLPVSWSPGSLCASDSVHGAICEFRSPVRVAARRYHRKRELGSIWRRNEEVERNCRGYVSCSASEEIPESARGSFSPQPRACDDVITFFPDGSSSRGSSNTAAAQPGIRREMAPSDRNRSSRPLASASNPIITIESTPLLERVENFEKLNWKGKLTVSALVVAGIAAASFVGVNLVRGLHGRVRSPMSKKGRSKEGGEGSLAYDVVAKGFATVQENLGPWSFSDLTLGLAAISKVRHIVSILHE